MIRIFKLVLLLVVSQVAFGQAPSNYININGRYRWIAGMFDSTFHIPKGTAASLRTGGSTNAGAVFYNTSDSSVYTYTGTQWIKLRGTIIDTTSLSNRINLKLNISDTASMLSPYLRKVDTTNKFVTQVYKKNGSDSVFYVRGGNHLWAFNDSSGAPGGGGGGKIYYFNGGVSMGTFGGLTMYELGDTANTGAAANFTRATTGNIANFITDPGKPGLLQIPAGVWSVDAWLSETGGGSNHAQIWVEVEKWDGSTITTIATSPIEQITEGSTPNLYSWSVTIPTTSLAITDRIIIQFYISNTNGKTVTLYTQNGYVGEVHTTFTTGIGAINGLTAPAQYLVPGTSGTDFNISSVTATHTFNLPTASAINRGALSSADWTVFNNKGSVSSVATNNATGLTGGTITTAGTLAIDTALISTRLWRQKGIDSVQSNLTAGLALKVNISDTSSMLSPYLRKIDTTAMLSPYARKNFINAGTGISYSSSTGTIANTAPDQTVAISSGTGISVTGTYPNFTITNTSPSSGGTVTSVATNNGTGITGGTITGAGTLAIDTVVISTRAWRQKGIDSVATLANTKVSSVSGTAPISSSGGTTPTISIPKATASVDGYLAYTDWNFFADKIGGSGTTNYIPKFTSSSAIGNSNLQTDASGNLGLAVTPSAWLNTLNALQIGAAHLFGQTTGTGTVSLGNNAYLNSTPAYIYQYNGKATRYGQYDGQHEFYTAPSGTAGNAITFTQAMTLNASGKLSVGTTATHGNVTFEQTTGEAGLVINSSIAEAPKLYLRDAGGAGYSEIQANNKLYINSANVGIGTTNPTSLLHLFSSTAGVSQRIESTATNGEPSVNFYGKNSSGTVRSFAIKYDNTDIIRFGTSDAIPIRFETTDIERMRITSGGYVGINEQSPNSYLHVKGSLRLPIAIKTATYTLTADDYTVVFDLNGNATANLPDATTIPGRIYVIKINRTNVANTLTIDPNGAQTIDGNATLDLQCQQAITIQSDGTNWRVIGDYLGGLNCL